MENKGYVSFPLGGADACPGIVTRIYIVIHRNLQEFDSITILPLIDSLYWSRF